MSANFASLVPGWEKMTSQEQEAFAVRLDRAATRERIKRRHPSGHSLSVALDSSMRPVRMLDILGGQVQKTIEEHRGRLIVSSPPQIGKSVSVAVWGTIRALVGDPSLRIIVASYSESLARSHVRAARDLVQRYGSGAQDPLTRTPLPDRLGIGLQSWKRTESEWQVAGAQGGVYAVGVGGSLSGKPADVLIVDDPIKGMAEADSEATKRKLMEWWTSVALARLSPSASVILVQTRWAKDDLAGHLLEHEPETWKYLNFPAVSAPGLPDALGRAPGVPLETSRGHTEETWRETERAVGPRVWAALYQGTPTPQGGGLFRKDWFDRYRLAVAPPLRARVVSVDPAETGHRDEAGLVALGVTTEGRIAVTHDWSERMTSDRWARRAVILALVTKAQEIVLEAYTTEQTYTRIIGEAWKSVALQLRLLSRTGGDVMKAAKILAGTRDAPEDPVEALTELSGLPVPRTSSPPFRVVPYRGKGDKVARAAGARQAAETGRLQIVGELPGLEEQAVEWQQGQGSPDRVDALVNGYNRLREEQGRVSHITAPTRAVRGSSGLAAKLSQRVEI